MLAAMGSIAATVALVGAGAAAYAEDGGAPATTHLEPWDKYLPPSLLLTVLTLICISAFFSASETAFFSIHKLRLRAMREGGTFTSRMVSSMMDHPGTLLTTILIGNIFVNVLVGVVLGTNVADLFEKSLGLRPALSYSLAVVCITSVLVIFGEIIPKVFAVRIREPYARAAAIPLQLIGKLMSPIRDGLLRMTDFIFRVTHFNDVRAAPFITDEELKSVLSEGEAKGVIEEEERQMIQGILEFSDVLLREILVPRPDVEALQEDTTVEEALRILRECEYSRMPVYRDDLDHITGILFAKDLLPSFAKGDLQRKIKTLARPPYFVPETMTVPGFVKDAQRHRCHLAIVVDEYGGTEGIVTLEDAIEQVVGEIMDEGEQEERDYEKISDTCFRVDGSLGLDELSELIGVTIEDEEHETLAGFLMERPTRFRKWAIKSRTRARCLRWKR
jgi:CBS domain containing-hemolysin-like protein